MEPTPELQTSGGEPPASVASDEWQTPTVLTTPTTPASGASQDGSAAAPRRVGLSWPMAAAFVTAEVAGSGMLALPYALTQTGLAGAPLVLVLGLLSGYCGLCLSRAWLELERRQPHLAAACAAPYPELASSALGAPGRLVTNASLAVSTFGVGVVYLVISAQLLEGLLSRLVPFSYCQWSVVTACLLVPVSWLRSPNDLWLVGAVSLATTVLTCLLAVAQLAVSFTALSSAATFHSPGAVSFVLGMGPILFSCGGASGFPTIQNDMKDRARFGRAVVVGYAGLLAMYVSLATLGYLAVGDGVDPNLLRTLAARVDGPLPAAAQALFLVHLVTAFLVVVNPFFQQTEALVRVPAGFGAGRVAFRTAMMAVLLLLALVVPDFVRIMDLLGSSSIALTSFVLPPLLQLRLSPAGGRPRSPALLAERGLQVAVAAFGAVVATTSTATVVTSLVQEGLNASCLLDI